MDIIYTIIGIMLFILVMIMSIFLCILADYKYEIWDKIKYIKRDFKNGKYKKRK